jgi:TonB-dependent starch-binding outer membrane protein SusC
MKKDSKPIHNGKSKMWLLAKCFLAGFFFFSGAMIFAQQKAISGKVTGADEAPLPGVTVIIKGTTVGTTTGTDGKFSLSVPESAKILVFSFMGLQTQEVAIGSGNVYDVKLLESLMGLDEVVVIGYGTAKKTDLTGAIVRVDSKSYQNQAVTQISQAFTGTVAGVYSNQTTAADGGSTLEVRGPTSLSAGTNPLIVLDGVIFNGSLSEINPADIQSVDVLKDASSSAVFGSKAASGVIIITTFKGTTGKPTISFTTKLGVSEITNKNFHPFQGEDYLTFRRDFFRTRQINEPDYYWNDPNDLPEGVTLDMWRNASANPADDNFVEWTNRLNLWPTEIENLSAGKTINGMDEVFQKGFQQDYDLSISGGTKEANYYWSVGYVNNKGIVVGDQFSALRSRLNVDYNVTDWLKVGVNSQFSFRDESVVPADLGYLPLLSPYGKMWNDDGSINWYPNDYALEVNPLLNYYGQDRLRKINSLFASMFAEVKLPLGITYRLSFQPRIMNSKDYNFWDTNTVVGAVDHLGGYGTRQDFSEVEWMVDNIISWKKEIGIHNFDLTLLYNAEKVLDYNSQYSNQNFLPSDALGFHGMAFGTVPTESSYDSQAGGNALMARLNYSLLGKYLFTASVRRDGYSAFGQQNPTAVFPAVAFAWKISDEKFFKNDVVNRLKLRLSWGQNGNRDIGIYSALAQLGSNMYSTGSQIVMGTYTNSLSNPELRWERTATINTGLDIGLFDDRIGLTVDYYNMTTNDLLMNRQLPQITGFSSITANLGELGNKGFEMTLNTVNVKKSKFIWRSNLVFSLNRNKIIELFGDTEQVDLGGGKIVTRPVPDYTNGWFPGQAIDVVWDYKTTGIWQLDEAAEADVYKQKPGYYKALDVNGDGNYTAKEDKQFIGHTRPLYRLGLTNEFDFLTNFTASIFIRADLGQISPVPLLTWGTSTYDRHNTYQRPYWTPTNQNPDWPSMAPLYDAFGGGITIYQPSSFVRIQDVSLAYNLPAAIAKQMKIDRMRIFVSVRNLCRFTSWRYFDPESGFSPMPRTYTFGLSLSL